ncbi:amidohydrolase family protein [Capillimicrobium parvum]|uniref:Atrazine chlorohydrolase n=1 Tax=Capillimicrobium parvum TaxID=2884022 RepID=A0A9E6XZS1_9ACTN|nr:amidohydrolase family protein [Capillimicrobium parvum]UGS36997.1 Atrazine chlorohydrolase [Capillimicrobium parvum]
MTDRQPADLVITAGAVVTMDSSRRILLDGAVAVAGTDIVAVARRDEILAGFAPERVIDAPHGLLTPGLIDVHNHPAGGYLIKGLCDDLPQMQRLGERVIPHEDLLTEEEAYVAALGTFAEMIRHGTTCFGDGGGPQTAGTARAAIEIGIRGVLAPKTADLPSPFGGEVRSTDQALREADEAVDRFDGAGDGRLRVWYDLDMPAAVSDRLVEEIAQRTRLRGAGILGHFLGFRPPDPEAPTGNADLDRYERFGLLEPGVCLLLAHINWLDGDDIARLAASGASIAHCPGASLLGGNGWVAGGVVPDLIAAGVNAAVGTDAAAISRFLDLVRTMHLAATAHKDARRDPLIMGAYQAFEMGTVNAARALGWDDRIGTIEAGTAADLTLFDATELAFSPDRFGNPIPDLIYGAGGSAAQLVVIDGRVVMEGGRLTTVDVQGLAAEIDRVGSQALERLGLRPASRWPIVVE